MEGLPSELGWPGYRVHPIRRWQGTEESREEDCVAEEAPVALVYNGEPHVVMLATPMDLEDFALGFSLTEEIVAHPLEVQGTRILQRADGIELRIRIPPARCEGAAEKGRNLTGRTGCGLCGARTLQQAVRKPPPVHSTLTIESPLLEQGLVELSRHQRLNALTGAVHAAGWITPEEGLVCVREDVGRHNALDKLIGALARRRTDFGGGFVVVTSRASFEMVQKCAKVGVGLMAAISAPTGMAIRLAEECGLTLVGFARTGRHVLYTHPQRLVHTAAGRLEVKAAAHP